MIEDEVRADEEVAGALAAEEATETEGDAVEETDTEETADEEAEDAVEDEAVVEDEDIAEDDRPEAQSVEEARDPAFKVSEGNPYKPTPADDAGE